jgi:hypothetical protein
MSECFWTAPQDEPLFKSLGLTDLEAVFAFQAGRRLDKAGLADWRQRWRIQLPDERTGGHPRTCYLKRFESPPIGQQFARWRRGAWRTSTAGVEWQNARSLERAGIACARPTAFGQRMQGPLEKRSFVILDEVQGCSLERWLPEHVPPPDEDTDPRARRAQIDALARFVGRFHAAGFVHRDLYLSHVFFTGAGRERPAIAGPDDEVFALIDLQRVFRPRWRKRRWAVKDLSALDYSTPADRVSRQERLRFLCRYVRVCSRFGTARTLARKIDARTGRTIRRLGPVRA